MCSSVVSLKSVRFVVVAAFLAAVVMAFAPAAALAQATFHGVGDLAGGSFSSQIRDATKHNGVIYAVGGGNGQAPGCTDPCQVPDTAILWSWDGVNAPTLTALPNLVVNTTATSVVTASAITPDGAYIASRARSVPQLGARQAVRVATSLVPFPSANFDLSSRFSPALVPTTAATAISSDGLILYGFDGGGRAVRFDVSGSSSAVIPTLPGESNISVAARGTSADGSVAVGASGPWAYRHVHGAGSTAIPRLAGGSSNKALAVSPDGRLVLVAGNSSAYPTGEAYFYNATSGATTPLGSPNSAWSPINVGGMTADGSVAAVEFAGQGRWFSYFRNSHGWFHLTSALGAQGIDVKAQGWTELGLSGMSSDGTLVFGSGVHRSEVDGVTADRVEGWVAEFPPGYLANFNPQPVSPSNTSIVGAWHVNDTESGSPAVIVFMADGTYYQINPTVTATELDAAPGFERGLYTWNAATGAFTVTTLNDTNGDAGLSDNNGMLNATVFVSGDTLSLTDGGTPIGTRIVAPALTPLTDTIVGAWVVGDAAAADSSFVAVFDDDGSYWHAQDGPAGGGAPDGIEKGTYSWAAGTLTPLTIDVDTNGDAGLSDPFGSIHLQPSFDGLTAQAGDDSGLMMALRILDPSIVTLAGTNVIVEPDVPAGAPPLQLTFESVDSTGATTVREVTPVDVPEVPAIPAGFTLEGTGVYYTIETTASFTGPVTVCFNYGGMTFSGGTPRLLHYDEALQSWVDITSSVNPGTTTICGLTSSFSPFAITSSPFDTRGFYAPVKPVAGAKNVVKGGATVPLKFNIFQGDGSEDRSTEGLSFEVSRVGCDPGVAEAPVPFLTTGGTSLRYDLSAGQFIQNWKTPKEPGCYLVRTRGTGILLSALFSVK